MKSLTRSLRLRLILGFIILIALTWMFASLLALHQTRKNVDEVFDTQQMLFAKRLTALNISDLTVKHPQLPRSKKMGHHRRGDVDDDALAFAIFTTEGKMVLNDGDNGPDLQYDYQQDGFSNGTLQGDKDAWRLVWLTTPDGQYRVVVGQEWDYRRDMAIDIIKAQLLPWVIALPIMVLLLIWLVTRELAPLSDWQNVCIIASQKTKHRCRWMAYRVKSNPWLWRLTACLPVRVICWYVSVALPQMLPMSYAAHWQH